MLTSSCDSLFYAVPCALVEVAYAITDLWRSTDSREVPLGITLATALAMWPLWIVMFLHIILWSIWEEELTQMRPHTKEIVFDVKLKPATKLSPRMLVLNYNFSATLLQLIYERLFGPPGGWTSVSWWHRFAFVIPTVFFALEADPELKKNSNSVLRLLWAVFNEKDEPDSEKSTPEIMNKKRVERWWRAQKWINTAFVVVSFFACVVLSLDMWFYQLLLFSVTVTQYALIDMMAVPPPTTTTSTITTASTQLSQPLPSSTEVFTARTEQDAATAAERKRAAQKSTTGTAHGGITVKVLKGHFPDCGVGCFGRLVNPYIVITFAQRTAEYSKPIAKGGIDPQFYATFAFSDRGE